MAQERSNTAANAGIQPTETVHHEPLVKNKPKTGVADLNLTSMLDVCFQLLIFFILTANFVPGEGYLSANLPDNRVAPNDTELPNIIDVKLTAYADKGVRFGLSITDRPIESVRDLYNELLGSVTNGAYSVKTDSVKIAPGKEVRWQHVLNAYNAVIRVKFEKVNFAND